MMPFPQQNWSWTQYSSCTDRTRTTKDCSFLICLMHLQCDFIQLLPSLHHGIPTKTILLCEAPAPPQQNPKNNVEEIITFVENFWRAVKGWNAGGLYVIDAREWVDRIFWKMKAINDAFPTVQLKLNTMFFMYR